MPKMYVSCKNILPCCLSFFFFCSYLLHIKSFKLQQTVPPQNSSQKKAEKLGENLCVLCCEGIQYRLWDLIHNKSKNYKIYQCPEVKMKYFILNLVFLKILICKVGNNSEFAEHWHFEPIKPLDSVCFVTLNIFIFKIKTYQACQKS